MSLQDTMAGDIHTVFFNGGDFCRPHKWNDLTIYVVDDREEALKRKQGNVMDYAWENARGELLIHVPMDQFSEEPKPETYVYFDGITAKVINVGTNEGVYDILLVRQDVR